MKYSDIFDLVADKQTVCYNPEKLYDDLTNEGFHYFDYEKCTRLTEAYYVKWYCTDAWVGYKVYFLDREPVAVSSQEGRKCLERFLWLSREAAIKTKGYLETCIEKEDECDLFELITEEELSRDIPAYYHITYSSQLLSKALYTVDGDKKCTVVRKRLPMKNHDLCATQVEVVFENGAVKIFELNDLYIPIGE